MRLRSRSCSCVWNAANAALSRDPPTLLRRNDRRDGPGQVLIEGKAAANEFSRRVPQVAALYPGDAQDARTFGEEGRLASSKQLRLEQLNGLLAMGR